MNGVTTALVGFIFVCVVYPHLIKNRPQFYAGLGLVCCIILLDSLAHMMPAISLVAYAIGGFLQIGAILLMFLAAGGLSWQDLAGEMSNAYEVIRRGGEKKEVIIPLSGAQPKPRQPRQETSTERIVIDEPGLSDPARLAGEFPGGACQSAVARFRWIEWVGIDGPAAQMPRECHGIATIALYNGREAITSVAMCQGDEMGLIVLGANGIASAQMPLGAVAVGHYINVWEMIPLMIVLIVWARLLTWPSGRADRVSAAFR